MSGNAWTRRDFLGGLAAGTSLLAGCEPGEKNPKSLPLLSEAPPTVSLEASTPAGPRREYAGPNVIVVRFGGGVRRRETIEPNETYSPFLCHEFAKRGVLFPRMELESMDGVVTSHGEGTLYILTGKYERFQDISQRPLATRFEARVPTVFEYLRKTYDVPEHQTLIINGEDRTDEEFFTFSNHHLFGADYRSNVLSLYRFKLYLLRERLRTAKMPDEQRVQEAAQLAKLEALDHRRSDPSDKAAAMQEFWKSWRAYYGDTGLVNPRGDSLLTELAIRALEQLRPRLLMINYNDCDYVHWGNLTHYTRGISIMDEGLRRIVRAVEADDTYRDNTVFVVVPDCGRDSNRAMSVPCQHHFGSRSSHEIFALVVGPGVDRGRVVDRAVDQTSVAATIGQLMNFGTPYATGPVLAEAFA